MVRIFLFVVFASSLHQLAQAQGIRGRITNEQGEPVSFANIYVPQLSSGTSSNIDGYYELKLPEGNWKVLFQYLGYQTQAREISVIKSVLEINTILITQDYRIPEIKVLASGEDPAYYIMRRAIAMAPYYRKQVSKYSCKVYLKGSGVFDKVPAMAKVMMDKKDISRLKEPFVSETVSKIEFELPDKLKQQVIAMRSSGKDNNTSPMGMITHNLYDAEKYGMISPVSKSALKAYNFRLDGVFEDQGRTINKIRVVPKIKGNDTFSGYIYIADEFWNIHSADLHLHMPMTDVQVHQVYAEVNKNTWMPTALDFDMDFSGMGFKMKFRYVASITEYKTTLNPALDHSFLHRLKMKQLEEQQILESVVEDSKQAQQAAEKSKAQKRIDELMEKPQLSNRETVKLNRMIETQAERNSPPEPLEIKSSFQVSQKQVNNDSAFWVTIRPIPLTETENTSFAKKDSFIRVSSTPEYQDSVHNSKRKFKAKHLIFGKTYDYSIDSARHFKRLTIPKLTDPTSLSFNSVDGLRLELPFSFVESDSTGRLFRVSPQFSYAFARKKPDAELSIEKRFNGLTNSWFSFGIGSTTKDFNRNSGFSAMNNDFYTLWLEENYNRYYRRDFVGLNYRQDVQNGLILSAGISFSDNKQLQNHSKYSFIDFENKEIQANIPDNKTMDLWQIEDHQTFAGRLLLEYTPRYRYRIRNHVKTYVGSKFPTFSLEYRGAYSGFLGSDSRFDQISFGIRQKIDFGIDDHLTYSLKAGSFLNNTKVYFEDFQHMNTQPVPFIFGSYANNFRLLPFYEYSTQRASLESHVNLQTRRFILKQLPVFRNSSMLSENLFVNFLSTPELNNYIETGYGIHNLFLLLNVEGVAGFENGKFRSAGIRVSLKLQ